MMTVSENFPRIVKLLQGLKGLTEDEAKAFFKICSKKSVSVKDVWNIFTELGIEVSRTKVYGIVEKYKHEGLIFQIDSSTNANKFKAIHPKTLLNQLNADMEKLDEDIAHLSESYETSDFSDKDPKVLSKILKSEGEILTMCNVLCQNDCELIIVAKDEPKLKHFYDALSGIGHKSVKGDINAVLFKKTSGDEKGVIDLTKRYNKDGKLRIFGNIMYDPEKYDYLFDKEVRRSG
jgi:sugar-specific transcriptional regulator TrmB